MVKNLKIEQLRPIWQGFEVWVTFWKKLKQICRILFFPKFFDHNSGSSGDIINWLTPFESCIQGLYVTKVSFCYQQGQKSYNRLSDATQVKKHTLPTMPKKQWFRLFPDFSGSISSIFKMFCMMKIDKMSYKYVINKISVSLLVLEIFAFRFYTFFSWHPLR